MCSASSRSPPRPGRASRSSGGRCSSSCPPAEAPQLDEGGLPGFLVYRPKPDQRRRFRILRTDRGFRVHGTPASEEELERALRDVGREARRRGRGRGRGARVPVTTGILGGAFDPPQLGHVALAQAALEQLPIDRLLVLVAAAPGHREVVAPAESGCGSRGWRSTSRDEVALDEHAVTVDAAPRRPLRTIRSSSSAPTRARTSRRGRSPTRCCARVSSPSARVRATRRPTSSATATACWRSSSTVAARLVQRDARPRRPRRADRRARPAGGRARDRAARPLPRLD